VYEPEEEVETEEPEVVTQRIEDIAEVLEVPN